MKKKILLLDESLTVQKVVSLTLDKSKYHLAFAKSRSEAVPLITEHAPDLILVSDQVADISVPSFPKELETWLGRSHEIPPIILITGQDIREVRHYSGVLKKPFSPQALQAVVKKYTDTGVSEVGQHDEEFEDQRLQKIFNDTFNDEANLVRETFEHEIDNAETTQVGIPAAPRAREGGIWGQNPTPPPRPQAPPRSKGPIMGAEDSMAYKAVLEREVEGKLGGRDLDQIVDKILNKLVPPIVERLVQERLDRLMKDQDNYQELKPPST